MLKDKIYIASDHAGFDLKTQICTFLKDENLNFKDLGTNNKESCDYPDFAHLLAKNIDETSFGIIICGSGIGVSIAANRHENIRCALCSESLSARLARKHNDANVLALGGRLIGISLAIDIITNFINTPFENGRHIQRIQKIEVNK
ncbi:MULTISPECIES: ribose 5-phosphate isomerase B [unclassified Campylobacter]|uniref:ribose 5-phosphate isomerase B n=1 Tax=unclassified Campylobacter TaxID=2593542 RepID=UPI001237DCA8|nr:MULTISPECIES: ribose 5-phosphate isomerase B [unclassified Campylobacter]KAA6228417.1 ribose 5-phosphate isomerase B [Campylobacter sp. LR185c]KAA6228903.1 ribose 5-phosphate isomerase B [Campylobacter sp. LR196d]KAA6229390.1 ribose 5-phosphate isomerase B [Campylobacter sp. LR286c]KAA6229856.1 ribose 5-phosphate isomerase B [Campylobacter sp. LR264d]KAA6234068.1 ribose 5-phosphate isomerase B [Campylobacter sp. LR291e]